MNLNSSALIIILILFVNNIEAKKLHLEARLTNDLSVSGEQAKNTGIHEDNSQAIETKNIGSKDAFHLSSHLDAQDKDEENEREMFRRNQSKLTMEDLEDDGENDAPYKKHESLIELSKPPKQFYEQYDELERIANKRFTTILNELDLLDGRKKSELMLADDSNESIDGLSSISKSALESATVPQSVPKLDISNAAGHMNNPEIFVCSMSFVVICSFIIL